MGVNDQPEKKIIRVLLIEDEPGDARLISRALRRSPWEQFALTWVTSLKEGQQGLAEGHFDLVLIDLSLPDSFGLDTVKEGCKAAGNTPVVVLTDYDDPGFALLTLDAGAHDYLVKGDFDHRLLIRSLRYALARSRTEAALRESEERTRAIFQAAENVSIIVVDTDPYHPRILEFSRGAEQIFGYKKEEMLGEKVEILHLPEDVQAFPDMFKELVQQRKGFSGESTLVRKSGEQFPALFTTYPMFDQGGELWGALGVSIDITGQKQVEEALRESEEIFRQMADNVGEVFWMRSSNNQEILYINKAYEKIWGRPREGLYRDPGEFIEAIHKEDKARVLRAYDKYIQGDLFDMEYRVVQPGGEVRWVWARSFPVKDMEGSIIRHTGIAVDITGRKETEKELQEKEEYLRGILESQLDLVVRVDMEGRFVYVNEAYCRAFGKTREELLGQKFAPLIHPEDVEDTMRAMETLYVPPYRAYMEQRAKTVQGWRWLAWQDYAIRDEKGEIQEIQGVGRDITEQKQAEEKLQADAEKYQTILATTMDGFMILDLQGRIQETNEAYCSMIGYTREELLAMVVSEVVALENPRETAARIQGIVQEGSDLFEGRLRRKDGKIIDVEVSATYLEANGGRLIVFLRDITERKHGERRLKESEERFRRIFEEGPLGMALIDLEDRFLMVNDELCQMLDHPREDLLEMRLADVTHGEDYALYRKQLKIIGQGQEYSSQQDLRFITRAGGLIWVNVVQTVIHDQAGASQYYLTMMENITERVETLDKLADYTAKTEMANLELENARDIALAASRAKSDFLSVMSHEIRTPMNSIIGMADLLAETSLSGEQEKYVRVFRAAGENLLNLINDILDLSKIESERLELEEEVFDLGELLEKTTALLGMKARDKGLQLHCSILPDVPLFLKGDGGRLQQILVNLLGNAVKFTNEGDISVQVSRYTFSEGEGEAVQLLFAIKDTGIGIPEDRQKAIFEEFTQVDSSITRKYGGTGLGLTISRRLAERLGGAIWVESLPGLGSTFYFTATFKVAPGPLKGQETVPPRPAVPPGQKEDLDILLVEDTADNRLLIQAFLKNTPYRIYIAENGQVAVQKVKEKKYNLVLMDIQMPVMDGYTATEEIRRWEKEQGVEPVPIIALTAFALKEEVQKALEVGCDVHLAKPVKKSVLLQAIRDYARIY